MAYVPDKPSRGLPTFLIGCSCRPVRPRRLPEGACLAATEDAAALAGAVAVVAGSVVDDVLVSSALGELCLIHCSGKPMLHSIRPSLERRWMILISEIVSQVSRVALIKVRALKKCMVQLSEPGAFKVTLCCSLSTGTPPRCVSSANCHREQNKKNTKTGLIDTRQMHGAVSGLP